LFHKNQMGFTLVEVMLAIAITGIITGGITMTTFQVFSGNTRTSNHMTAVRQVQNAGYWVSHDAQMAQILTPTPSPDSDGFPLTLSWTEWDGTVNTITYTLGGTEFVRDHNGQQSVVAQFIESVEVSPRPYTGGALTFNVTATVGEQTETRIYEVMPRPGS
jgi:prepilin-type N-terminal cleavage/methylation domain-containing protein